MQQRLPAILLVLILLAFCGSPALAAPTSTRERLAQTLPQLSTEQIEELLETGRISRRYAMGDAPVEIDFAPAYSRTVEDDIKGLNPTIGVEVLFLIDSPLPEDKITLPVFHTMQAMSTMEGIQYYSASRERMRTFFHESYVVDDAENRERIPDPRASRLPDSSTIFVYQHDSSFGKNVYELTYTVDDDALLLRMTNLTQMYYQRVLPALGPEQLQMHLIVKPLGGKLLFYGTSAARPGFLFGMEDRVVRSFYNRLVALNDWFVDRTDRQ